jgi:GNAT superfamily N-acetyltransferase
MEHGDAAGRGVIVRPMSHADLGEGLRLCRASNWNQLEDDWRFFLDHGGASLAVQDGSVVGSVGWLPFDRDFAWLSMMLVDPGARRGGIGSKLMEGALEALAGQHVRLDATPAGEPMYRKFGFLDEYRLARTKVRGGGRLSACVRAIEPADLPAIFVRDREVFGADRSAVLSDLYRRAPDLAWMGGDAYCFGRPGYLFPQLGPVVASDLEAARAVIEHCLAVHEGQTFVLDLPDRADGIGFEVLRPFLRMSLGEVRPHGRPEQVFAITGPEFG